MTYPILEFSSTREALIEPSRLIDSGDVPEHCVICFFWDVIEKVVKEHDATVLAANQWEDGRHPVYEMNHRGRRLAFLHPGVGSAHAVGMLEETIALGCRKFIACGGCGVLDLDVAFGHLVVVSAAVRDEGASYHYLPPSREVQAGAEGVRALAETLDARDIPYCVGKTWTTDAPYRETPDKIVKRREEGCLVVEMEAAGMIAVTQFRDVVFGQVLYGGDDLTGEIWDNRDWDSRSDVRERLFWLCADAVLTL